MRYPEFLKPGGTIGFVAPSFGCAIEPYRSLFDNAQKYFKQRGYGLDPGPCVYSDSGIGISSSPAKCGQELTRYYCSASSDVLISCGGGELMCEVLDYVDFEKIKKATPKWYMGYSDNTNMTFLLATLADTASIYGPCAPTFGRLPWHPFVQSSFDLITGKNLCVHGYDFHEDIHSESCSGDTRADGDTDSGVNIGALSDAGCIKTDRDADPLAPINATIPCVRKIWPNQEASVSFKGRLIGGCLDILTLLAGTEYDRVCKFSSRYEGDGIIWFLESCDLNPMDIRRSLWHLEHAGWFSGVSGFLIGRPLCHGSKMLGMDQYLAVTGILGKYNVPILMDLDIGHIAPMMPLICGSLAHVRACGNDFSLEMKTI